MAIVASIKSLVNLAFSLPAEKSWSKKKKRLPGISPVKMSLFGIIRELQFKSSHMKVPWGQGKNIFVLEKKEVERTMVNRVQGLSWLSPCQERRKSFLFGGSDSGYHHRAWEIPLLISQLFLIEDFYSLILLHFPIVIKIFYKTITDQKSDFLFPVSFCSSE